MSSPPARRKRRGAIVMITLDRPEVLNASNAELATLVGRYLDEADRDPGVRAIIITGSGRAFCAGADLADLRDGVPTHSREHPEWRFAGVVRHPLSTPLIAAVNGLAYGGGLEIVLAADLAVAADDARFALPEVRWGLIPGGGGAVRAPARIGLRRALELGLTGDSIDAPTALAWGLVNRVVPARRTLDAAMQLAESIASHPPAAVARVLEIMRAAADAAEAAVWELNDAAMDELTGSLSTASGIERFSARSPGGGALREERADPFDPVA